MSTRHLFIDETKHRDYLLVAAVVPDNLAATRKMIRELLLPGQRRLHMKDESDPRRRVIASAIVAGGVQATVFDAGRRHRTERDRRRACLHRLVAETAGGGDTMLVLEQDDTLLSWDNQCLIEATRATGQRDILRYEHRRPTAEQLLALPDAIAWCWAKGGDWRRRIAPVITAVCEV